MEKIVAILFAVVSLSAIANTWTDPNTGITWWYVIMKDGACVGGVPCGTITSPDYMTAVSTTTKGAITIPATLGGYSVTSIYPSAFRDCSGLTSITIPSSVTSIGSNAFSGCSGLTSIAIPSSVTSIGGGAFRSCSGLRSVAIPSSVTGIGYGAFSGCSGLTSITLPFIGSERGNSKSYSAVFGHIFGWEAYSGAVAVTQDYGLGRVTYYIPTSLKTVIVTDETKIGYGAFSNYSWLSSITLPSSVMSIDEDAFSGCSGLNEVHISDIATWCEIEMPPHVYECAHKLYVGDKEVTNLIIPEGVTRVGYAFSDCSGLTSVTIPSSVTSVDYCAFSGCGGLMSFFVNDNNPLFSSRSGLLCSKDGETLVAGVNGNVIIPNGIMDIERGAFSGLSGLMSVTIPEGVTYIKEDVFLDCTGLKSVTMPSSIRRMEGAFSGCCGLQEVHISDIATWCAIERSMFSNINGFPLYYAQKLYVGDDEVKDLVIPEGVTYIYDFAFYGFSGLRSITIPQSVKHIGFYAFADCSSLISVILPSSITYGDYFNCFFDGYAFCGCSILTSMVIPKGERVICPYTFAYCNELTSVTIPESVEAIGSSSFEGCSRLTSIMIPKSVEEIGENAFYDCNALKTIYVDNGDVERVKEMLNESGFDTEKVQFRDKGSAIKKPPRILFF